MSRKSLALTIGIYQENRLDILFVTLTLLEKYIDLIDEIIIVVGDINKEVKARKLMKKINSKFQHEKISVVLNKGNGLSNARNTAVELTSCDLLAFLDDDAIPKRSWFEALSEVKNSKYDIIAGKINPFYINSNERLPKELNWIVGCTFPPIFSENKSHFVRNPIGANMVFDVKKLEQIGGFGTHLGRGGYGLLSAEETEVATALNERGSKCWYLPHFVVDHIVPPDRMKIRYIMRRAYYEGYSKSIYKKIKKTNSDEDTEVIKLEGRYLINLLHKIVLEPKLKLKILLLLVIIMVGIGYIVGYQHTLLMHINHEVK